MNFGGYDVKESDWKIYRKLVPQWQEKYMDKLMDKFIVLLKSDKLSQEKFWELKSTINKESTKIGVTIRMSRSTMFENLLELLQQRVITYDDLEEFSQELKEEIKYIHTSLYKK